VSTPLADVDAQDYEQDLASQAGIEVPHMDFKIPRPLKTEHEELHVELERATKVNGRVGEEARNVAKLLHPHFRKEEGYAMPPLGLLRLLVESQVTPEMRGILAITDRLEAEVPDMIEEHQALFGALRRLAVVALQENRPDVADFADKMRLHAQTEEEVLYPAAILVGRYVRARLQEHQ
jgi:hypothetical protein